MTIKVQYAFSVKLGIDRTDDKVQNVKSALYYPQIPRTEEANNEIRSSHVETRIKSNVRILELEK